MSWRSAMSRAQIRARAPQSQQYFYSTHCAGRLAAGAARTQDVRPTSLRRKCAQHRCCATEGSLANSPQRRRSKAMAGETETGEIEMERAAIVGTSLEVSRVALG